MQPLPAPILVERPHPATLPEDELLEQCTIGKGRASGPGGQNRNKVETKVMLAHEPTGVEAHAGERRSAEQNKKMALFRLRLNLATDVRAVVPIGEVRSELWLARCPENGGGKISCNPSHRDYPALLAEAMDVIYAAKLDIKRAAARLMCSPSQLVKLVKDHPHAMARLNADRLAAGLHGMH